MRRLAGGLLALAALYACQSEGVRPSAILVAPDSADQVLFGMATTVTSDGVKRSLIMADTAYVYQARQDYDLRNLRITFFDPQGLRTSEVTARSGTYNVQRGSFDAFGNVEWVNNDGTRILRTERLHYDKVANELSSDTAFVFHSGADVLTGSAFHSDTEFRNVTTERPRGRQGPGSE